MILRCSGLLKQQRVAEEKPVRPVFVLESQEANTSRVHLRRSSGARSEMNEAERKKENQIM